MQNYTEKYRHWLNNVTDAEMLNAMRGATDEQIKQAFATDLHFGTAGMRGIMSFGTGNMNIYTVYRATAGLSDYMLSRGMRSCAITYDSRINSKLFGDITAATLAAAGIEVYITRECMPTPFLSYAIRQLGCDTGVNITASHNPSDYNGYKVYDDSGCQLLDEAAAEVTDFISRRDYFDAPIPQIEAYLGTLIHYTDDALERSYIDTVIANGVGNIGDISVVYTPLNGAGYRVTPAALAQAGLTNLHLVDEQTQPDGNFPTCPYPNPENDAALKYATDLAMRVNADIVIANDPDCDRLGVAIRDGDKFVRLSGNQVGILLTDYVLAQAAANKTLPARPVVVKTVVTSAMADAIAGYYGAEVRNVLTGFKYIGDVINKLQRDGDSSRFVFGFEESCGYLKGDYARDKDGVIAALLVVQCASYYKQRGISLAQRMRLLEEKFGTYTAKQAKFTFDGVNGADNIARRLENLRARPFEDLAGSPVTDFCDYLTQTRYDLPKANMLRFNSADGSQLIVRPSGTEPLVKCYLTACGSDATANEAKLVAITAQVTAVFGK